MGVTSEKRERRMESGSVVGTNRSGKGGSVRNAIDTEALAGRLDMTEKAMRILLFVCADLPT